ncbi:MAG: Amidohydrolase 3 [Actinomycetia bacterium]|nr:Amidohydrolase 3 [Actinomycetes bacterium]
MMTLLEGADVIDGTGAERVREDVLLDGDRIAARGRRLSVASDVERVDLNGRVLAPGFIDIHTHYDAQIMWDPDLSPSSWHGVTTVIAGNCGFTLAPCLPRDRNALLRMLSSVEAMPIAALNAGVEWSFETFPEYLAFIGHRPKRLNVGFFVGHTAIRTFVMGEGASDRLATDAEIASMRAIVSEAMDSGAVGFSTSQSTGHIDGLGRPVASRSANKAEIFGISDALRDFGRGIVEVATGPDFTPEDCASLSVRTQRPVTWIALLTQPGRPGACTATLDALAEVDGQTIPQISCRPFVVAHGYEDWAQACMISGAFTQAVGLPPSEQRELYASPSWRDRARNALDPDWERAMRGATIEGTWAHRDLRGVALSEIADDRGTSVFDAFMDIGLEDDLATDWRMVLFNDDEEELADLLNDDRCLIGLGDGGAHLMQLCDAIYPTYLLGHWVRERRALTLERAVWCLTGQPAAAFSVLDRGRIEAGTFADLVAFDPARVGTGALQELTDFPAGSSRLVGESVGIEDVWVGGVAIRRSGEDLGGARPGRMISVGA